jgi:hypothetical protein
MKYIRKKGSKNFDLKTMTTNYSNNADDGFPPFSDPEKELKNVMN